MKFTQSNIMHAKERSPDFLPVDATQTSRVMRQSVCFSVCPSVTFRYRDYIGWNTSKIISRPYSLRHLLTLAPTWAICCNGNTPKMGGIWVGHEHENLK